MLFFLKILGKVLCRLNNYIDLKRNVKAGMTTELSESQINLKAKYELHLTGFKLSMNKSESMQDFVWTQVFNLGSNISKPALRPLSQFTISICLIQKVHIISKRDSNNL